MSMCAGTCGRYTAGAPAALTQKAYRTVPLIRSGIGNLMQCVSGAFSTALQSLKCLFSFVALKETASITAVCCDFLSSFICFLYLLSI